MATFRNLSKAQDAVFSLIATGADYGHNQRTLKALLGKNLISKYDETLPGQPPVRITRYYVPAPIHYEWCQWCHEHVDEF